MDKEKASAIKKILMHQTFCQQAEIFNQTEGFEKDEIIATGKEALVLLCVSSTGEGLDNLQKILSKECSGRTTNSATSFSSCLIPQP